MANIIVKEFWLPVNGYEGSYEVSNHGRVRSLNRVITRKNGKALTLQGTVLSPRKDNAGYFRVLLRGKDYRIHRLVAEAFITNDNQFPCVNHLDGNKQNNLVTNLEWCTYSTNMQHACDTGLLSPTYGNRKLKPNDVVHIRELANAGYTIKEIALTYSISLNTIRNIVNKVSWANIA